MGRDWLKNTMILLPVIGMMALAGYYLWQDTQGEDSTTVEEVPRETIGTLQQQTANVKRKLGDSLYWNPIKDNDALFANDSIRTGASSAAVIQLQDKSQIQLAENSLIVLEKSANALNVDFKTGDIETKGGSAPLSIKVKDNILEANQADLKLSTDSKNNTQIVVTKGTATLKDKQNQKTELSTKNAVNVDESGQAKKIAVPLILNTPKDKIVALDPERKTMYPFTWTVLDENLKEEFIEISSSTDFQKISFTKPAHQAVKGEITRGINYWRVGWRDQDKKVFYSEPRELRLEEDRRLTLTAPQNQAVINFEPSQDTIGFSWSALGDPKVFLIEVAKDPRFDTVIVNKTISQRSIDIPAFKEGQYYWRIRAFSEDNNEIGRTSTWSFIVRRVLPQLPVLSFPTNGFKWTLNDPLNFEWKPTDIATQYRVLITKDPAQNEIINQNSQKETKYLWKWAKPGDYYWSIIALNDAGEITGQSVVQKIDIEPTVTGPAIILKQPPNQETVNRERRDPMDPVVFQWDVERPIASGPFTFFISEKPDFAKTLKKEGIEDTRFSLRIDRTANYYWRVEWANPSDTSDREVSIPFVLKYRVSNNLPAPTLVDPLHQARKVVAKKESLDFRWQKVEGADQYRFTLERENLNTQEKIPVMTRTTSETRITSIPLEPGSYYWSVSSIDKEKNEGTPSQPRAFVMELNKELLAPKLNSPVVK